MTAKRERHPNQGWAKHRRNFDGGARLVQKRLRRKAKDEIEHEMLDSKQVFIVSTITRESIAECLNQMLSCFGFEDRLEPNDKRLTDEICAEYAEELGKIDFVQGEEEALLCERTLRAIKINID